jgi:hypothetical protein
MADLVRRILEGESQGQGSRDGTVSGYLWVQYTMVWSAVHYTFGCSVGRHYLGLLVVICVSRAGNSNKG